MTSTLTLRTSNLKLPPSFVELDREEMSYVTGGGSVLIGTYAYNDNTGAKWLANEASWRFAAAGIYAFDGVLAAVLAGISSPSVIGAVVFGIGSALCFAVAGIAFGLGQSASNALADAKYAQSVGKRYSVYVNKFLGMITGYVVRA